MNKQTQKRKQLVNRIYKCPPLEIICPSKVFNQHKNAPLLIQNRLTDSNQQILQIEDKKCATQSQWSSQLKSAQFKTQKQSTLFKKSDFSVKKKKTTQLKRSVCGNSPYVKNRKDYERILELIKPVKGPTQSLICQIQKHNDQNRKNVQNVILGRKESFKMKMMKYSSRLGLHQNSKIFVMNSKDTHIREVLTQHGWVEALDQDTTFFHLKWVYTDLSADYNRLQNGQFYNHFKNNQELTNKNLLRKNINKAKLQLNFPLTYDLDLSEDVLLFKRQTQKFQYFKMLNSIIDLIKIQLPTYFKRIAGNPNYFINQKHKEEKKLHRKKLSSQLLSSSNGFNQMSLKQALYHLCAYFCHSIPELQKIKYSIFEKYNIKTFETLNCLKEHLRKNDRLIELLGKQQKFITVELVKIYLKLIKYWEKNYGIENAWIIKPAGVSRGSGITIENDYQKIYQNKYGKIVQKYIEKPLILDCGRKFDIRQWVLVKSFLPLEAYVFERCYCRFSSEKYSNDKYTNLKKHLTNYSQQKQIFSKTFTNWNSILSEEALADKIGVRWKQIKKQIKVNILKTLKACEQEVTPKPQCFEVYGFDIIIDEGYKPWILQVNLSPACEKRAQFIHEYLRKMSLGILDLIEDRKIRHWQLLQQEQQYIQMSKVGQEKVAEKEVKMEKLKSVFAAIKIQRAWKNSQKEKITAPKQQQVENGYEENEIGSAPTEKQA